jgi:2-dehydro-3-deoxygalactonokinase
MIWTTEKLGEGEQMIVHWVALDWGTTNLAAYAIGGAGQTLDRIHSDKGMSQLVSSEYEATLLDVIGPWLSDDHITPVVACGMVGSQQGWFEAPYSYAPC